MLHWCTLALALLAVTVTGAPSGRSTDDGALQPNAMDRVLMGAMLIPEAPDANGAPMSPQYEGMDMIVDETTVRVELDIMYTREDFEAMQAAKIPDEDDGTGRYKRKATSYASRRWTSNTIPYTYTSTFTTTEQAQVQAAMDEWQQYTCIRFREKTSSDQNYIYFQDGGGCSSYVGMIGGSQPVTLATGCRWKSVAVHELGHAVGFQHEQTRPDRNNFVTVFTQNIMSGMAYNFDHYSSAVVNTYSVPYDYKSIMHYGAKYFSANGKNTIETKDTSYQDKIGRYQSLSFRDIKLAHLMYNCAGSCGSQTCPGEGFVDSNCQCQCPGSPVTACTGDEGGDGGDDGGDDGADEVTEAACSDLDPDCPSWANTGYCTNAEYSAYMQANCGQSCGTCGNGNANCADTNPNCAEWKALGECETYPTYMFINCALTCYPDACGAGTEVSSSDCVDLVEECESWANNGECDSNPDWMRPNCPKSCQQCGGEGGGDVATSCIDLDDDCSDLAETGFCTDETFSEYMQENCGPSCGSCGNSNDEECEDENDYCADWAAQGDCVTDPVFMLEICKKSCNDC